MSGVPISQHGLLSDCGSAALVTASGSVDWLCLNRFDSAPVLGRLLDDDAGHFSIAPAGLGWVPAWRYRPSGLVLETTWTSQDGELEVVDALALGPQERGHDLGRSAPGVLLRRVRCTSGVVPVQVEYAPRPEFGLIHPRLIAVSGAVLAHGGAGVLLLSTSVELQVAQGRATGTVTLQAGEEMTFALEQYDAWGPPAKSWKPRKIVKRLKDTEKAWRSWSVLHQHYEGPLRELVYRSGVVLQGLTYARTGAVIAAVTSSLPEGVGSGRTWDYRFTWVRDASLTLQGLHVAACPDEADRFFAFLARAASTQLDRGVPLQIMFGIGGERDLSERELPHLTGWRDSGPVRVGNGAWDQDQLDVYGALLDAAYTLREQLHEMEAATRSFLVAAVDAAAARWREDDQGIWEIRGAAQPFLHSKVMCWVALDRGIKLAALLQADAQKVGAWRRARDEVRQTILEQGWSEDIGAYTQALGSDQLDASALMMSIVGFLPGTDPRVRSTIDVIERELTDDRGLVYRYRGDDGLDGSEGTFLLCTFWLAHALALSGQVDRARRTLQLAADCATPLGLFAEQVDSSNGELLGNFPQAFSHLGLVTAAQALAEAEQGATSR